MLNTILALLSVILLILCMLCPQAKKQLNAKWLNHHIIYAVLLIIVALIHGILAGKHPAMLSGKLSWLCLIIFVVISIPHHRFKHPTFKKIHRSLSIITCGLILIHIIHALVIR